MRLTITKATKNDRGSRANDIDQSIKVEASTFRPGDSGSSRSTARLTEKIINEGKVRASYPSHDYVLTYVLTPTLCSGEDSPRP